ncbi:hypothetical protein QTO34_004857 [Cnephaeus nilssonii]|nr:hypothetical protein QTO34_004857 [Eptesicus nilssonii]
MPQSKSRKIAILGYRSVGSVLFDREELQLAYSSFCRASSECWRERSEALVRDRRLRSHRGTSCKSRIKTSCILAAVVTAEEPSQEALQHSEARMGHEDKDGRGQEELGLPASNRRKRGWLEHNELSLSFTGKSSLTIQFVEGQFVDSYDPTIENTFTKLITVNGQEYHLQLVDTAGQDEYSIFPQTYSIDINGYILVYSVTSIKSFEVIKVIHGKLLDMVGKVQIPIMLVGNKKDLHMERVISYEEGKALAESWNAAFLESSAKENQTAVDVFRRIILEAEKIDGAASQGKSSCSVM